MILQALYNLYDRFLEDPSYDVALDGFSLQKVSFAIVLNQDGSLHEIQDHRTVEGKKARSQNHLVLGGAKPTGAGINPCFLWDNTAYLLGYKPEDPKPERTKECFERSRDYHLGLKKEIQSPEFDAVCRFFEEWNPELAKEKCPVIDELSTGFGVFMFRNPLAFIHEDKTIQEWWLLRLNESKGDQRTSFCLLTGKDSPIADLHQPKIKGVKDAQGAGALIVSFHAKAYESYGKEEGFNAPVSEEAAGKYCKALNALLSSDKHRIQVGDASTVFWTEKKTNVEASLGGWFSGLDKDASAQDLKLLGDLEGAIRSIQKGGRPSEILGDESETRFFILGLTGQAGGRIGIRFWHQCTLTELFEKLAAHHQDMAIVRQWGEESKNPDPEFPKFWQLLRQTARESKDIPPNLSGALIRSVLAGTPYPEMMASAVINRIRADRDINYLRAAILKGWLTRLPSHKKGIPMSLDEKNTDPAYLLGRLFAALEKTQGDALGDINASIRDRFYSSASATPATVFPRLMRTYQHHLAKLPIGAKINREQLVQEIMNSMNEFPAFFNTRSQGLFAIGYYHQRKDFYTKKSEPVSVEITA